MRRVARTVDPKRIPEELDLAWQLFDNEEYDEAHRLAGAILLAGPQGEEAVDAYHLRGEILLAKGDTAAARPNFARAYALLGDDKGLQAQAPERLARLKRLGGAE